MAAAANPLATEAGTRDPARRRQRGRRGHRDPDRADAGRAAESAASAAAPSCCTGTAHAHCRFDGRETAPSGSHRERCSWPDGTPMAFYRSGRRRSLGRHARRCPPARHWRTASTASCHGRGCSSRRSGSPKRAFALSPRLYALLASDKYLQMTDPAARAYFYEAERRTEAGRHAAAQSRRSQRRCAPSRAVAPTRSIVARSPRTSSRRCAATPNAGSLALDDLAAYTVKERRAAVQRLQALARLRDADRRPRAAIAVAQMLGIFAHRNIAVVRAGSAPAWSRADRPTRSTCSPKPGGWPSPTATSMSPTAISCAVDVRAACSTATT